MTLRAPCFIVHTNTPVVPPDIVGDSPSLPSAENSTAKIFSSVYNVIEDNGVRTLRSEEFISSLLLDKTSEEEEAVEEEGESSSDDGYISMKELKQKSIFPTVLKEERKLCSTKEAQKKEKRKQKEEAKNLLVHSVKRDLIEAATDATGPTSSLPSDRDWGVGSDFSESDSESEEITTTTTTTTTKSNRKIQILKEDKEWRLRELRRIKRSKEDRERSQREEELLQSERNLTEEEKQERDVLKMNRYLKAKGAEMNFMQRYYHKGSFFIDDVGDVDGSTANTSTRAAELLSRDYGSSLTGGDTSTTTMLSLPSLKQVRNWGKRSRSKWTHLVEEDTTSFDYGWGQRRNELNYQLVGRMGGMLPKRE